MEIHSMNRLEKLKKSTLILFVFITCFLFADTVFATSAPEVSLGDAALNVTGSVGLLAQFITSLSYVLGFGFGVGAILKYKNHRDNPSQVPLGTPITLIFIALAFVFMPMIFSASGNTIFGAGAEQGTVHGVNSF